MNKQEISKIVYDVKKSCNDLKAMYIDCPLWDTSDFVHNSELVVNITHDIFDKISILQSKYTSTDSTYLEIVIAMEEHLEEGKIFKLNRDIDVLIKYLEI